MNVGDVMTREVEFVAPDATIQEAAVLMAEIGVGALPVGGPEALRGILTDRDIFYRVVARGESNTATRVRDVMSATVFTCREDDAIATVLDVMGARNVRRLPVVDADGKVTGLVTLADIARRLLLETGTMQRALEELSAAPAPT
jgi:CBS domain-containing protein